MLYAGKDSHKAMTRMLNNKPNCDGGENQPIVKESLLKLMKHRRLNTKMGLIAISYTLGGDLAFLAEFYNLGRSNAGIHAIYAT